MLLFDVGEIKREIMNVVGILSLGAQELKERSADGRTRSKEDNNAGKKGSTPLELKLKTESSQKLNETMRIPEIAGSD